MYRDDFFYAHIPKDWPRRANKETYEFYAQLPSWHLEQAAALVTGYIPRATDLDLSPAPGDPQAPRPSSDAKTWYQLIYGSDEPIRNALERFGSRRRHGHFRVT